MNDEENKHVKITRRTHMPDGSDKIETESYYDELSHTMEEREKPLLSTTDTLLQDAIACLGPLKQGSPELTLTFKVRPGNIIKITKRWVVGKQSFNRR